LKSSSCLASRQSTTDRPRSGISGSLIGASIEKLSVRQTGSVTGTFQLSLRVRVACSVPLVLLAGVLAVGGIDTGGVWGPLGAVGAVFVLVIAWRSWQLRVDDLGDGVRIVNWTLTVEVPWDEIDPFEFDGRVSLRRRDLRTVPLSAFPFPSRDVFGIARRRNHAAFLALESIRKKRRKQARKKSTTCTWPLNRHLGGTPPQMVHPYTGQERTPIASNECVAAAETHAAVRAI
jgi:hypothetical protein